MDDHGFDALARTLAGAAGTGVSRRTVLAALLGAAVGLTGARRAQAGQAPRGCDMLRCNHDAYLAYRQSSNLCAKAPGGYAWCMAGAAVALAEAGRHCEKSGGCWPERCCNGACQAGECQCPPGETPCAFTCVDTSRNADHCGACDVTCGDCETCQDGHCAPTDCGDGLTCCNNGCHPVCPPGQRMDPQSCQCLCPPDTTKCGDFCCDATQSCCPDSLRGHACRFTNPVCGPCQEPCGDICCPYQQGCGRRADYSYYCTA